MPIGVRSFGVLGVEHEDHRAGGVVDDLLDQLERVRGAFAEADQRDVRVLAPRRLGDFVDVELERDDLVSERAGDLRYGFGPHGELVGHEDA